MKKDSNYYRKQEQREQLKYIPIAIIYLVIGFFCYVALFIEEIEIGEYSLYGISKFFFITETLIFGGVGSLFSLGSLIFLVWTAELKRKSGGRGHPWFPILFSLIFLCIGFLSFLFTKYLSLLILENCHGINLYMAKIIYFEKHSFFCMGKRTYLAFFYNGYRVFHCEWNYIYYF